MSEQKSRFILVLLVAQLITSVALLALALEERSAVFEPVTLEHSRSETIARVDLSGELIRSMRLAVAAELEPLRARLQQGQRELRKDERPSADTIQDTAGAMRAFSESQTIIATAIAATHWSATELQELQQRLFQLSSAQRQQLAHQFHSAINNQQLKIDRMELFPVF